MDTYRNFVSSLAEGRISKEFLNSDEEHALEVFVNLFKNAKEIIRIFAGGLCSPVANNHEYIRALSDFIERNGEVLILLNNFDEAKALNSDVIRRLAYYIHKDKKVKTKKTNTKPYYKSDPDKKEVHFTVCDDISYRIETDVEAKTATCNFNNKEAADPLIELFDKIFSEDSEELDLKKIFNLS